MRQSLVWRIGMGLLVWLAVGCVAAAPAMVASVPPQAFIADRLVGQVGHTAVLIPSGSVEESYAPTPKQLKQLTESRIYFRVGHRHFPVEAGHINPLLRDRAKGPVVVDLVANSPEESPSDHEHHHAEHAVDDPHVWLSITAMRDGAQRLAQALQQIDPANAVRYAANLQALLADIDALTADVRAALKAHRGRSVMVYHPAWIHLLEPLGLQQLAIESDGKNPSAVRFREMIAAARREQIRTVFAEKGFSRKAVQQIADEIDGRVVDLDPLAYDWLANLRYVAQAVQSSFAP